VDEKAKVNDDVSEEGKDMAMKVNEALEGVLPKNSRHACIITQEDRVLFASNMHPQEFLLALVGTLRRLSEEEGEGEEKEEEKTKEDPVMPDISLMAPGGRA
jgi:hypothetical protein